jgi:Ca-activated chloride channel family protein
MLRTKVMLATLLLLAVLSPSLEAGRLYARKPDTASPLYNLALTSMQTHVTIRNFLCVTHLDETFSNQENQDLEGFYVFQLPQGATVDGLWMWVDGERYTFIVKKKEEAKQIYDSLVQHNIGDPALLENLGSNRFQLRIYPIKANSLRRIELQYFQLISMDGGGNARYTYPMNLSDYQNIPVASTSIMVDIDVDRTVDSVRSSSPSIASISRLDSGKYRIGFIATDFIYNDDFRVSFQPVDWDHGFPILTYCDPDTVDDGYFLLWTPPPAGDRERLSIRTDYMLVLDGSGSMTGQRKDGVIAAIEQFFSTMLPIDRFRIITFARDAAGFPADTSMLFASKANIDAALYFLRTRYHATGVTNYGAGITEAITSALRDEATPRMVFITDGLPTLGPATRAALDSVLRRSPRPLRFDALGIYTEVTQLLNDVSLDNYGGLISLEQGESLDAALSRLVFGFDASTVLDATLRMPAGISHLLPPVLPKLATLSQLVSAGRFSNPGTDTVAMEYEHIGLPQRQNISYPVPFDCDSTASRQIAKVWASLRIAQLLSRLQFVTDSTAIRDSVIALSVRFNILTPFTAFIVIKDPIQNAVEQLPVPATYVLRQNYPNPFTPSTRIDFVVPAHRAGERVVLAIFNSAGRHLLTLYDGEPDAGTHSLEWNGRDASGTRLPSGIYFAVLLTGHGRFVIPMTLVR